MSNHSPELWLEAIHRRVREHGDHLWMTQPVGAGESYTLTWRAALDEAKRIAAHLVSRGYPRGSTIAILGQNSAHFILMDLAIWMAGHVSVPLYATMLPETIRYVLDHSRARAIFIGKLPAFDPAILPAGIDTLCCRLSPALPFERWEDVVARTAPLTGEPVRGADELAVVMYTSGTTGNPKGVELTFGAMAVSPHGINNLIGFGMDDRMVSYLPLAHAAERLMIEGMTFAAGIQVYFCESLATFASDVRRARPTGFIGVPRVWMKFREGILAKMPEARLRRLLKMPILGAMLRKKILRALGFDALRLAGTGAAPIPQELVAFFSMLGIELLELYGLTENFGYSHLGRPGQTRLGWVGPPMPGVEARLADDGEVQVRSPASMRGYHRDADATATAFTTDGFLRTGDRGEIDADGRIRIVGRTKEIFKTSKGKYVAPAGIENALQATGVVEQACVMGLGEPQPVAIVVIAESHRARSAADLVDDLEQLVRDTNGRLPPHERLARVVATRDPWTPEDGLLTPTMKVKRASVEDRFLSRVVGAPPGVTLL